MKTIRIFGIRRFTLAAIFSVGLGFVSSAFAQTLVIVNPDGKLTYLGTLGGDPTRFTHGATDINDSGQVVGYSATSTTGGDFPPIHAFITGPNGAEMTNLDTLDEYGSRAYGINDAGQVVGVSSSGAFITGPNGVGMTDIGTLGGTYSRPAAINDGGRVVGYFRTEDGSTHAYITGPNGAGMTDLGTLGGTDSEATDINDAGQVVGYFDLVNNSRHAFITGPNGAGMTDIGTVGGLTGSSRATGINNTGQVVGVSSIGDNGEHAFITGPNGEGMTSLVPGTSDWVYSVATDINDAGQVVGFFRTEESVNRDFHLDHAFITGPDGKGIIDLNSYVDLADGYYLYSSGATGINNLEQVIATVTIAPIPEPASYALMLAGLGLVGFMVRGRRRRENTLECR